MEEKEQMEVKENKVEKSEKGYEEEGKVGKGNQKGKGGKENHEGKGGRKKKGGLETVDEDTAESKEGPRPRTTTRMTATRHHRVTLQYDLWHKIHSQEVSARSPETPKARCRWRRERELLLTLASGLGRRRGSHDIGPMMALSSEHLIRKLS